MESRLQNQFPGETMPRHLQAKDSIFNRVSLPPGFHNAAVERCCKAWHRSFKANSKAGTDPVIVIVRANEAYRFAMPPLTTPQNLCDFIACVTHALALNLMPLPHASALMEAARAASHAFRLTGKPVKHSIAPGEEGKTRKNKKFSPKMAT